LFITDSSILINFYFAEIHDVDASWEKCQRNSLADLTSFVVSNENILKGINKAEVLVLNACSWWEFG
jgi:hypothetical protein